MRISVRGERFCLIWGLRRNEVDAKRGEEGMNYKFSFE